MNTGHNNRAQIITVWVLISLCLVAVAARMFQFQVYLRRVVLNITEEDRDKIHVSQITLLPERGRIFSRNGTLLAGTLPRDILVMERYNFLKARKERQQATVELIASIQNKTPEQVRRTIENSTAVDFYLERFLSEPDRNRVLELITARKSAGLRLDPNFKRYYPMKDLASTILGYVDRDGIGQYGVDGRYDDVLKGKPRQYITAMDALSRPMFLDSSAPPQSPKGADIELTLDEFIQSVVEQELDQICDQSRSESACAIVMDPNNGDILAMAQYPRFDPNEYPKFPIANYRNIAISSAFEPGSLAKCFTVYAALAMGQVKPDTVITCESGFRVGSKIIRDVPNTRYGDLTVTEILAKSNNVGTVKLALQCGNEAIYQTFREFGMSGKTGIDLPSEGLCTVPRVSQWSKTTIAVLPYGYEMMATPIGLCRAYAMIANGGRAITPRVVRAVVDNETNRRLEPRQPVAQAMLSAEKTKLLADMMSQTMEIGTGRHAKVPGFSGRVAAKSGTAVQIEKDEHGRARYSQDKVVASFIGFLPVEAPRVVIGIHIWSPSHDGPTHGGDLAGPVFARIADYVATRLHIPRNTSEVPTPTAQTDTQKPQAQKTPSLTVKDYLDNGVMPDVKGMTKGEVYELLKSLNLEGRFEGFGLAHSQEPAPGVKLEEVQVCRVNFSDEQLR